MECIKAIITPVYLNSDSTSNTKMEGFTNAFRKKKKENKKRPGTGISVW